MKQQAGFYLVFFLSSSPEKEVTIERALNRKCCTKERKGKDDWNFLFLFFFVCFALFARVQLKNRSFKTETSNMHGIGWGLRPVCRLES